MKLGKRILALLACVLLCFAPAVLMVGAAEISPCSLNDNLCNCGIQYYSYNVSNAVNAETIQFFYLPYKCRQVRYIHVPVYCSLCDDTYYADVYREESHVYSQNTVNGRYYCRYCDMEQP